MRKLPELRRKKGVTRKDVAAGVGITLGKYDRWEAGKVLPKVGDVDRLTEYYGISIDEIYLHPRLPLLLCQCQP